MYFFFLCSRLKCATLIVQCLGREVSASERKSPQSLQAWRGQEKRLTFREEVSYTESQARDEHCLTAVPVAEHPVRAGTCLPLGGQMLFIL